MAFDLERLVRRNIRELKPYSSARSEFAGVADVFLDANENSFGSPAGTGLNRYPDPLQKELKTAVAKLKGVDIDQIFVGNGSDEAIDILFRVFCEPGRDEVIICPPTYGMYRVSADINDVAVREVWLTRDFRLDLTAVSKAINENTKLVFICSPNNPTGNLIRREDVLELCRSFAGIVLVDEAYIDFADEPSMAADLAELPNLVVLQTFSKAWGMAGVRVGLAFASAAIIGLMNAVKPPYNVSEVAQRTVLEALVHAPLIEEWVAAIKTEREGLGTRLERLGLVEKVYPSDANFLLVKVADAGAAYKYLVNEGIVVRDRSGVLLCGECLRITVGTPDQNQRLIAALGRFDGQNL